MDLQTRKIAFVQEFLKIENEKAISNLEKLLTKEKVALELKPMGIAELQDRIDRSAEDSKNGKLTESGILYSEIQKWS